MAATFLPLLLWLQLAAALTAPLAAWGFRDFLVDGWRTGRLRGVFGSRYARLSALLVALILHLAVADLRVLFAMRDYLAAIGDFTAAEFLVTLGIEVLAFGALLGLVLRRDEPGRGVRVRILLGLLIGATALVAVTL